MKVNKSSIFATLFLVLSLITVVGITENPLKGVVFQSYARVSGTANANRAERQALKEGGDKWTVLASDGSKHQCKGSECYGIQLGTVQSAANAKKVVAAVLTNDQILEKACTNEGGRYIGGQCYENGQVPVATPKSSWNANDFAQVAQSNGDNGQIATVRALCQFANPGDACKNATFLEKYALNFLNNADTSPNKSIYNNALNKFNQNQDYINKKVNTVSGTDLSGILANEQKFGVVLPQSQDPSTKAPAIETVAVHTNNAYDCRVLGESGNKYYSFHESSHLCFLNPKNSGIDAAAITQEGTKATLTTPSQCAEIGRTGQVKVSYANGICTQQPVSAPPPPIQKYLAPTTVGNGYYLSCIQSQCPTGTRTTYGAACACAIVPPQQTTFVPPAGTSETIKIYFETVTGTASTAEKAQAQTDCINALKITCDTKTLQTFVMTQLKATNPTLYQQALAQGVPAPAGAAPAPATAPQPAPAPAAAAVPAATGNYAERDFAHVPIPNINHTLADRGCGVIAVTNIIDSFGGNLTPQQVLAMIPANAWHDDGGLSGVNGGEFTKVLNAQGYSTDTHYFTPAALYDRVNVDQRVWLATNVTDKYGKIVPHITYVTIDPQNKNTFILQKNDYFGNDMTCKPSGANLSCSNNKGDKLTIPVDSESTAEIIVSKKSK